MKNYFFTSLLALILIAVIFTGCTPRSKYDRKLKHELSSGTRNDSLFMGLYLGMTDKDFYMHCWELNKKGLIKQGPNNTTVEYIMKDELKYPASMNFYPLFVDGKIAEMPAKFIYTGWAPWNEKLSSDSLQIDVLNWCIKKYGDNFMVVEHPSRGNAYVQLKGNRRITIFKENEMNVWVVITDMTVKKEVSDSTAAISQ